MNDPNAKPAEVKGSNNPEPEPKAPSANTGITPSIQLGSEFHKNFGETTKYTVFVIFLLYSVGFIIWHSSLGKFGVSAIAFLQAEYLAAAFCYLFVLATLSIPPVLLLKGLKRNIVSKGFVGNFRMG